MKLSLFRSLAVAGALVSSAVAAGASSAGTTVDARYMIYFIGIPLARASLDLGVNGSTYDARVEMNPSGVGHIFTAFHTVAWADGALKGGHIEPHGYGVDGRDSKKDIVVRMAMQDGTVERVRADPPLKPDPTRIPVTERNLQNVVDPLSSGLMPYPEGAPLGPEACNRMLPIYDGWTRYDVRLSFRRIARVKVGNYEGPAAVCGARWVPIAGHRPGRKAVRELATNTGLEVWLIPVPGAGALIPFRVTIDTHHGMLRVEADRMVMRTDVAANSPRHRS